MCFQSYPKSGEKTVFNSTKLTEKKMIKHQMRMSYHSPAGWLVSGSTPETGLCSIATQSN